MVFDDCKEWFAPETKASKINTLFWKLACCIVAEQAIISNHGNSNIYVSLILYW